MVSTATPQTRSLFARCCGLLTPLLLTLLATAAVVDSLVIHGLMSWHFQQSTTVHGGIEILVLAMLAALCAWRGGRLAWTILAAAALLYLRRHHVDLPVFVGLLSAEALVALGMSVLRTQAAPDPGWRLQQAFLTGAMLWWALMLILHGLRVAEPANLLMLFAVIGLAAIAWQRQSFLIGPGLRAFVVAGRWQRVALALLGVYLLLQAARSNAVIGFDTLWYLSRGQYVLAPNGSLFEPLGLVSAVHYAPKLFEAWLLPWEAVGDLSFQFMQTQVFVVAAGCLFVSLCRAMGMPEFWRVPALIALLSVPAVAATALQLKNDILAWYLVLLVIVAAGRWLTQGDASAWLFGLAASLLAVSTKLTVLPVLAVIMLVVSIAALRKHDHAPLPGARERGPRRVLALAAMIATVMLVRTWILCGLPTIGPEPLVRVWEQLGFALRPPAGTLRWLWPQVWSDVPWLLPELLFHPDSMPKVRISWTGHAWLICSVASWCWLWQQSATSTRLQIQTPTTSLRALLWATALTGVVLLCAWRYDTRGGDGNYYLLPMTAACALGFSAAARAARTRAQTICLTLILGLATITQAALSMVSAGWSPPGTRAWDWDFDRSVFDTPTRLDSDRAPYALNDVHSTLAALPRATRTLVIGPSAAAYLLPTRTESLEHVLRSRPETITNQASFAAFLKSTCTAYVVVDKIDRPELFDAWQRVSLELPKALVLGTPRWQVDQLNWPPPCNRADVPSAPRGRTASD